MNIRAGISSYPLRKKNLAELIGRFISNLHRRDLKVKTGTMFQLTGETNKHGTAI